MKLRNFTFPLILLLCFLVLVSRLEQGRRDEGKQQLENALRRTAVSCYASEGFYPADVDYLLEHYALVYDNSQYAVHYTFYGSNLMPDITVVEK